MLTVNTISFPTAYANNTQASLSRRAQRPPMEPYRPSRSGPSPIQTIDASHGRAQPVVIHLAPPPPPKTRKRVDAFGPGAAPAGLSRPLVDRYSKADSNDSHGAHSESTSSSDHSPFDNVRMNRESFVHEVSYTYPFLTQTNEDQADQPPPLPYQRHQHQDSQNYSLSREPITLTYEPPKLRKSLSGRSLIETTETEEGLDLELDLEDLEDMDQDANGDLDLESEMHRALSRSSSMASSAMSAFSDKRRSKIKPPLPKMPAAAGQTSKPKPSKLKSKKGVEDPAMYIHKRGSLPPAPTSKKLFGWEFGWDPSPKGKRQSGDREMKEIQESSFLDFRGIRRKASDKLKDKEAKVPTTTTRKLKRYSSPAGAMHHRTSSSREAAKMEKLEDILGIGVGLTSTDSGTNKKLKKRSKSVTRADEAGVVEQEPFVPEQLSKSMPRSSFLEHRKVKSTSTTASSGAATSRPGTAESKTSSSHGHRSSASLGGRSLRRDGLGTQLKKSFKLGVGRTLGPNLTLASAGLAYGEPEWKARKASRRESRDESQKSIGSRTADDDDEDVHSVAAAKLVSASIARVTPAATILAAPSSPTTPSPTGQSTMFQAPAISPIIAYIPPASTTRPALPPIVTSPVPAAPAVVKAAPRSAPAPNNAYTPQSSKAPRTSGSSWKHHPFADPPNVPSRPLPIPVARKVPVEPATPSPEDDVLQLEREMEEMRRQSGDARGEGGLDSPTAPFKELAAFAGGLPDDISVSTTLPAPSMNASMTPSLNSIFALAHAQAQTVAAPPLPATTPESGASPDKLKGKIFGGGQTQKRTPLSAPPVSSKSVWGPQSPEVAPNAGSTSAGLPYKFPLIFPNSFSNSGSPPKPRVPASQQQQSASTPGTPKGASSTSRLSSMTMGTVRNVFAGVGARMSSATIRMSVSGSPTMNGSARGKAGLGHGFGEMVMEAGEGDFMDLTDPFAPPPPSLRNKVETGIERFWEFNSEAVQEVGNGYPATGQASATGPRRRMSAWGKLPMPARPSSPALSAVNGSRSETSSKRNILSGAHRTVRIVGKPSRKHKKKARRSTVLAATTTNIKANAEDADFGLEEALLSQRLLSRLDADVWEIQV
ncbi:hypothetical protein CVT26_002311 [Gymnopilus dilepis]|uniref:Uncharacterized protein n=1 Tax=Gymnopilus dilepis TaxID=231916 RepID=A0A409Y3M1_9AGAR|nr:hypothetical protein CVT26_002311 [Gymnopilus dilepis]